METEMSNQEVIARIEDHMIAHQMNESRAIYISEALKKAISAVRKIDHLTDRPCLACEFHKENGCSSWDCVFED